MSISASPFSYSQPVILCSARSHLPTWAVKPRAGPPAQLTTPPRSIMLALIARNIIILPLLVASFLATATAQDSTTAQDGLSTSSAPPDSSPYPTAMIFLPGSLHDLPIDGRNLAASVITAVSLSYYQILVTLMNPLRSGKTNVSLPPEFKPNSLRHHLHACCIEQIISSASRMQVRVNNHRHRR